MGKLLRIRTVFAGILLVVVLGLTALPLAAQGEALQISARKQFGGDFGNQIQGQFLLRTRGPEDLVSVTYQLDGEMLGEVTEGPDFNLSFNTDTYAPGPHRITAVGRTADGRTLTSNVLDFRFLSGEEVGGMIFRVLGPLLGVVLLAVLIPVLAAVAGGLKTPPAPGEPRKYGLLGGTICPRCGQPFALHWWGMNAGVGKFDRCPYCGKWSLARRAGAEELARAEAALTASAAIPVAEKSEEEKLREQIERSRYL